MATTTREMFADCPTDMIEWMQRARPEWLEQAERSGGLANVPEVMAAWAAWDAAVCAAMRQIHEAPIRELHDRVYALLNPPPMA